VARIKGLREDIEYQRRIDLAAAAIANSRAARRGVPPISNVLDVLSSTPALAKLRAGVIEEAEAALEAIHHQEICAALDLAYHQIRVWHNTDLPASTAAQRWEDYCRDAPEMQPILVALKLARGD
jgi:histone H3/H4